MKLCTFEGCNNFHKAKGLCVKHYSKLIKRFIERLNCKPCSVTDCSAPHKSRNYCSYHYDKFYRSKTPAYKAKTTRNKEKRYALIKAATPAWADLSAIRLFYQNRPAGHNVDHIIPLAGTDVCGLHVLENLQYLPAAANKSKSNKFQS